jgi:dCMP deaminase
MRPNRDHTLMVTARAWAEHSTCSRLAVGAVISRDGRSFSTGYNGAPAGMPHCDHSCNCPNGSWTSDKWPGKVFHVPQCETQQPCLIAVHAELNALMFAARYGLATEGAELHTTHQPCLNCAMAIVNAGVVRVVYEHPYRDNGGLRLLQGAGVHVMTMADLAAQKGI